MRPANQEEYGALKQQVAYLVDCCKEVRADVAAGKTRSIATLTTVVVLLLGTVINLVLYYAK